MKKINIGIIAHVDAGKTTLTENILFLGGVIAKAGRVDSGDTRTDSMEVERRRGISVKAAAVSFYWKDFKINLIDTPGHVDFVAEVERSLGVLDGAVLIVSAREGLQSQTRILMDTVMAQRIPAMIFINKLDRPGADAGKTFADADAYMNGRLAPLQRAELAGGGLRIEPLAERELMERGGEALYTLDEELLERYINGEDIPYGVFCERMAYYTRRGELYPVCFGSALRGLGVAELLDQLTVWLPPAEEESGAPVSGVVFKVDNSALKGKDGQKLAYVRLYRGRLRVRDKLFYSGQGRGGEEKISRMAVLDSGKLAGCSELEAGDIGVVYCKEPRVGDTLGEADAGRRNVRLGRPTLAAEVLPEDPGRSRELYEALTLLAEEDPLLELTSGDSNKLTVRLFGEVQTEILREQLLRRYGIAVSFSETVTIYMETPCSSASAVTGIWSRGNPFAAGVGLRVEPLARGSGLRYVTEVSFGDLERTFQRAVEEAVFETCRRGVYGWEVTDARVVFEFSRYDSVNSTPSDFRNLTPPVLMEALANAGMELLEPMLEFELRVPEKSAGRALFDCERMRAGVNAAVTLPDGGLRITGLVPADACKGYGARTASYTEGQGVFVTKFHSYQSTPFDAAKVNEERINPALNRAVYLLRKLGARRG